MDAKELGQEAAYPRNHFESEKVLDGKVIERVLDLAHYGLTKREAFAMNAPEPHPSFEFKDTETQAAVTAANDKMHALLPPHNSEDNSFLNELQSWRRDPCFDLVSDDPTKQAIMDDFAAAHEKWRQAMVARDQAYPAKQRAAWAVAYADALLNQLAKEQP